MACKGTPRWELYHAVTGEFLTVVTGLDEEELDELFIKDMYPNIPVRKVFTRSKGNICSRYNPSKVGVHI